jgi:hypothetical protein
MITTEYNDRKFMIFNVLELNQIDFNEVLETSSDTVTKSVNQIKTFVKWDNLIPECVNNLTTKEGPYTYNEILEILNTNEWTVPIQIP